MSAGAPPSSPDPLSSRVVVPSDPVAMPSPPPAPPVAAEDEERPWPPPMKMKLFPYAMYCVFGGMGRTGDMLLGAYLGMHIVLCIVKILAFSPDAEEALFWTPIFRVVAFLCFAATTLMTCVFVRYYMPVDGVYVVKFDPPQQQPAAAAAAEQLPPPPPEMDMC